MEMPDKSMWVQKIKSEYGKQCKQVDITLVQTSKDKPVLSDSGKEVKINPFNDEKGKLIRDSFSIGKLDWATDVITTEPASPNREEEARKKMMQYSEFADGSKLFKAMKDAQKVRA